MSQAQGSIRTRAYKLRSHLEVVPPKIESVKQYAKEQAFIVAVFRNPESATELRTLAGDKIVIVKGDMEQPETFHMRRRRFPLLFLHLGPTPST
jgi:hypothetical protein